MMKLLRWATLAALVVGSGVDAEGAFVSLTLSDGATETVCFEANPPRRTFDPGFAGRVGIDGRYPRTSTYALAKFDLGFLAPGSRVSSATLDLVISGGVGALMPFRQGLGVTGIGSDSPTAAPGDFMDSGLPIMGGASLPLGTRFPLPLSVDVSQLIDRLAGNTRAVAFQFSAGADGGVSFSRPTLNITYEAVPEPSSLALCGVATLAGLGVRARRRRVAGP